VAFTRTLFTVLILLASTQAFAQTALPGGTRGRGMLREACKSDVASLCKDVQPGGGRIKECLQTNKDKLSQGCKDAIATMKARGAGEAGAPAAPQ
jgi:hypothetical protein